MILKIIGAMMIAASCAASSVTLISHERKKLCQSDSFIALIKYIRNQIDCYSMPIDRIFLECPGEILDELGGKEDKMTFSGLLSRESVEVDGETSRILSEFASSLGKNYRDRQVRLCDAAISELERVRGIAQKDFSVKKKTIGAMCTVLGGLVIILFL